MKILIIRTDKLGDFYISLPFVNSLIRKFGKSSIDIVVSETIYKHFISKDYLFNNIYSYPKKNLFKKIKFIKSLRKQSYNKIIVFDGKDRSILLTYFLKGEKNLILIEKRKINFLIKFFFSKDKFKLFINNKIDSYHALYTKMIIECDADYDCKDNKFLIHKDLYTIKYLKDYKANIKSYLHIHLDEKWFTEFYIKDYTNINPNEDDFIVFINDLIKIKKKHLIITTGLISLPFVELLKEKYFIKVNQNVDEYKFDSYKVLFISNSTIIDLEIISMNAHYIITCNGPISQIACSYDINLLDILEKKLETWYDRHISNKKNYKKLFRKNFIELSKEILNKIK